MAIPSSPVGDHRGRYAAPVLLCLTVFVLLAAGASADKSQIDMAGPSATVGPTAETAARSFAPMTKGSLQFRHAYILIISQ